MTLRHKFQYWLYASWLNILIRYRSTVLGPLWLVANPLIFIVMIGFLFAKISGIPSHIFIPHVTLGVIVWSLFVQILNNTPNIITQNKSKIVAGIPLNDIIVTAIITYFIQFMHVLWIALGAWFIFKWDINTYALTTIIGIIIIIINGYALGVIFGILGSRFNDLAHLITTVTSAMFFITPIIWMPGGEAGRGGLIGSYLIFNPLYHFMELVRAPVLNNPIDPLSWYIVIIITLLNLLFARLLYHKLARKVTMWI